MLKETVCNLTCSFWRKETADLLLSSIAKHETWQFWWRGRLWLKCARRTLRCSGHAAMARYLICLLTEI